VDLLANDLGFVAVFEGDALQGYQVYVGGGQGMTHNKPRTFPRIATAAGFIGPDQLWQAATAVIALQRDNGDRSDRRRARLKYVVEDRGIDWVREELRTTYGLAMAPPRDLPPLEVPELLGWHEQGDGRWWLGLPVPSGRIEGALRTALREAVQRFGLDPVFTPQQDVLLSNVAETDRAALETLLRGHGVTFTEALTPLSRWALACTALPFCGLALTEAERVREPIVADVEAALARHGLAGERISLRITGCPNGCVRPYTGDIGLVGRVPGQYAVFVGGDFAGTRLSFKLLERVPMAMVGRTLEPLFAQWAARREGGEGFGDFCTRMGPAALLDLLPQHQLEAAD
jgi:sulfite reductase (ferredoxin)